MSLSKSSINSHRNLTTPNLNNACVYEFEDFRLDASHLMLYRNGTTVSLKPKVVETLVALVERSGEVVSKDELMDRLWRDAFVEEGNLSQNIYLLRKTLGNRTSGQPLIETFWRRGYRFNGKVRQSSEFEVLFATHTKTLVVSEETVEDEPGLVFPSTPEEQITDKSSVRTLVSGQRRTRILVGAGTIAGVLLIFAAAFVFRSVATKSTANAGNSAASSSVKITRLTPDMDIRSAAISPDGEYAAYDLIANGKHSLWMKDISSGGTSRIGPPMDDPYFDLTFSPRGTHIYFNTPEKNRPNRTIFRMPAAGGEPQAIAYDAVGPITFSPDHRTIAFIRGPLKRSALILANADGSGDEMELVARNNPDWFEGWGSNLSWSPDGTRIAVCGGRYTDGKYRHQLTEISVADGSEKEIPTRNWNYLDDVLWLPDQSALVVRARETQTSPWQIWRISYPDGGATPITNDLNDYDDLSLSADGRSLVVNIASGNLNLWTVPFHYPGGSRQLTSGASASDGAYGVAFTNDGEIVYTSPRDGHVDLWMLDPAGGELDQLTKNAGELNGGPHLTPDGRYIVFVSSRSGSTQLWRMDSDGGNPIRLSDSGAGLSPKLSPDGQWVYFDCVDENGRTIAKVSIDGGNPVIVKHSDSPIFAGPVSPDGRLMAVGFYDDTSTQPWKHGVISLASGELTRAFEGIKLVHGWTKDSRSLVVLRDSNRTNLWLQPIDGSEPRQVTRFDSGMIRNFAVSPDFSQVVVARGNPTAEAVLISNFR